MPFFSKIWQQNLNVYTTQTLVYSRWGQTMFGSYQNSSAHSICFWMSAKCLWSWINEQERYYYFNRRHQEIKPCGRLCEWREEVNDCICVRTSARVTCVSACTYICKCRSLVVQLHEMGKVKKQKTEIWELDQRGKGRKFHVCILTHLRVLVCICANDWLWSQKKRGLYFRAYALFSRTHNHRP